MSEAPRFPVLWECTRAEQREWEALNCPHSVPWDFVAPHAEQARINHDQSLARLAERGGLSPGELLAVVRGEGLRDALDDDAAVPVLLAKLREWTEATGAA